MFYAPHLRHFLPRNFAIPIGSPFLSTAAGLITLSLTVIPPLVYFHPGDLLAQLSLMPQLETLRITFHSPISSRDVVGQLLHMPITAHVTLPNLRWLTLGGINAYLEALLSQINATVFEKVQIIFFNQLTLSVPHLLQFLATAENLRFRCASLTFRSGCIFVRMDPRSETGMYALSVHVACKHLDWQVASAAQLFDVLRPVLSSVEYLYLKYKRSSISTQWRNEADRTRWRELLRPLSNAKTLSWTMGLSGSSLVRYNYSRRWRITRGTKAVT